MTTIRTPAGTVERRYNTLTAGRTNTSGGAIVRLRAATQTKRPRIAGYAAVFNSVIEVGGFREKIAPGAFDDVIADRDMDTVGLFNHDPSLLLGRRSARTLQLSADRIGLAYEIAPPNTQLARDVIENLRAGNIIGSSFAFRIDPDGETWTTEDGLPMRTINRVAKLFDVGAVTFPAYSDTTAELQSVGPFGPDDDDGDDDDDDGRNSRVSILRRRLDLVEIE